MKLTLWTVIFASMSIAMGVMPQDSAWGQTPFDDADTSEATDCALSEPEIRWIQAALDGWESISGDVLGLESSPLPWMVLFGRSCTWHLASDGALLPEGRSAHSTFTFAGESVLVRTVQHDSAVWLPSGSPIPVQGAAFTSLYERAPEENATFFVLALPEIWRDQFPEDPNLEAEMLGVAIHELVHTHHISHAHRQIEEMEGRYTLPERIHDDMVEERFAEVIGFREAHESETDLLYRAVSEPGPAQKRALVRQALELIRARQDQVFPRARCGVSRPRGSFSSIWKASRFGPLSSCRKPIRRLTSASRTLQWIVGAIAGHRTRDSRCFCSSMNWFRVGETACWGRN